MILAIDPGPTVCGVVYASSGGLPSLAENIPPAKVREYISRLEASDVVVCEQIRSYGMPVGADVFDTVHQCGRFHETAARAGASFELIPRRDVKLHHCGSPRAKDANVRQAILDRFGGRAEAIGRKKKPGPLYGVTKHAWAALALALYVADRNGGSIE